jgi:hypothetical protein
VPLEGLALVWFWFGSYDQMASAMQYVYEDEEPTQVSAMATLKDGVDTHGTALLQRVATSDVELWKFGGAVQLSVNAVHLLILRQLNDTLCREGCALCCKTAQSSGPCACTKKQSICKRIGRTVLHLDIKIGFDRLNVGATDSHLHQNACHGALSRTTSACSLFAEADCRYFHSGISRFVSFVAMRLKTVALAVNGHLKDTGQPPC